MCRKWVAASAALVNANLTFSERLEAVDDVIAFASAAACSPSGRGSLGEVC